MSDEHLIHMQKITPNLWFKGDAEEAVNFYLSVFPESKILSTSRYPHEGLADFQKDFAGKVLTITFQLFGQEFVAINAGPEFSFNPSVSFMVNFDPRFFSSESSPEAAATEKLDAMWQALSAGGKVLMPLDKYPFSERYGWVEDKYGLSWQLISGVGKEGGEERPAIVPSLMFVKEKSGKAKEARSFYLSVFKDSPSSAEAMAGTKDGISALYPDDIPSGQKKGDVMFSDFELLGVWFAAMDGGSPHEFDFSEAVSFSISCKDQEEIDYYWEKLSAVPEQDLPAPRPDTFYVYVIHCNDDSMYIGQTQDLRKRWREHDSGAGAEHTRRHKPLGVVHYEEFKSREEAVKREHDLKTGFGRKWIKREWKAGRTRQAGQCGWLKDKYGLSWQVTPENMGELMRAPGAFEKMMKMKKIDVAAFSST